MRPATLRHCQLALAAFTLLASSACQRTAVEPAASVGLPGEWNLRATGGGITGAMSPVAAGQEVLLRFNADGTYSQQAATQSTVSGTYQLRREARGPGQPDTTLVLRLTSPAGSPHTTLLYVSRLNATELRYATEGGCPFISHYGRTAVVLCGTR